MDSMPSTMVSAAMSTTTSGDAIADRRFAHAMAYREAGDISAAAELVEQALELAPRWAEGWLTLGELREALSHDRAAEAYRHALSFDPADRAGAGVRLARLGAVPAEGAMSPAHVAALFDDYAPRFEASLVERLGYRAPGLLREAVQELGGRRFSRMIDL